VLLVPITVLAAYGLSLRIGQYGLSPDRILAAACVLVAAGYAIGYAVAAVRPGAWMKALETTNIAMAFVVIAVLLALCTPVADPRRLSVGDQVARLHAGKVKADQFDFTFLRFKAGRVGRDALIALGKDRDMAISQAAAKVISTARADELAAADDKPFAKTRIYPAGASLPASFVKQDWTAGDWLICAVPGSRCDMVLLDTDGDGVEEVLVGQGGVFEIYRLGAAQRWTKVGTTAPACIDEAFRAQMRANAPRMAPAPTDLKDVVIGGRALRLLPVSPACADDDEVIVVTGIKRP
jgi:hypothetical protein